MKTSVTIFLKTIACCIIMGPVFQSGAQESKVDPRVDVAYFQVGDEAPYVTVRVRKRVERRYEPLVNIPVEVYFTEEDENWKMGSMTTNAKGEGKVALPSAFKATWNDLSEFEFIAVLASSDTIEGTSESTFIKRSRIQIDVDDSHETRKITVRAEEKTDEEWVSVADAELKVFVHRYFGNLPVGDDFYTADEEGMVEVEFSQEFPGDKDGTIVLGAMLEEHDDFGTVVVYKPVKWGVPLKEEAFTQRTLWSARNKTPWWLLIFPNLMILGVWGVIVYLVIQIYKIRQLANP